MKRKFAVVILAILVALATGCGGIKINPNIEGEALDLILSEAGYDLAYLGLKNTDTARLNRICDVIDIASAMLDEEDVTTVIATISEYVLAMPEFKLDETYQFLVYRATNLLDKIVDIEVETTEDQVRVVGYVRAFLQGGRDGINRLILNRIA